MSGGKATDDILDKPSYMERRNGMRTLQGQMADRSLLQTDQANAKTGRLSWAFSQWGSLASLDRLAGLRPVALYQSAQPVDT